jgi:hypothetical protein
LRRLPAWPAKDRYVSLEMLTLAIQQLGWNIAFAARHYVEFGRRYSVKKIAAVVLFLATGAFAATFNGVVSDQHCGMKHAAATAADKKCVQACIKGGAAAVLLVGDKVYKIDNQDAIKGHEGDKVTVNGKLIGDTIHIDSVK